MKAARSMTLTRAMARGGIWAVVVGLFFGLMRYWLGYFIVAQGAAAGALIAWLFRADARRGGRAEPPVGGKGPPAAALVWFCLFMIGQAIGFGLAQPWFDPFGWAARVFSGRTSEFVFGVAANAAVTKGFAGGVGGWFWIVLSLIDWAIMLMMLLVIPWGPAKGGRSAQPSGTAGAETES